MHSVRFTGRMAVVAAVIALLVAVPASASAQSQSTVTAADIQRLQDNVYDASNDLSRLRSRDASLAERLQADLDALREEVIYLKVKQRKDSSVSRSEYNDVRGRIEDLRARARGEGTTRSDTAAPVTRDVPPPATSQTKTTSRPNEVPVGTELDVRLQAPLSSGTAQVEDRFTATTVVDMNEGSRVLIPAGSVVRGIVTSVDKAGRIERRGRLTLSFDQITINGRSYPINATVTQALESEGIRGEAGKIGAGAGIGAVIGGILGGFKGVLAGILIGGGGTIAATEGKDVELPAGTVLRLRFDSPVTIR